MFTFKQFAIDDNQSTMKVGTDAVLLGAIARVDQTNQEPLRILEVGTGCGVISLMMAQRFQMATIDAIDIDNASILQAQGNFTKSLWEHRLHAINIAMQDYQTIGYDLIVSNPPYFENSLKAPNAQRNLARHTDTLPIETLIKECNRLLNSKGDIWIILPCEAAQKAIREGMSYNLYNNIQLHIHNKPNSIPKRTIFNLSYFKNAKTIEEHHYIRNDDNCYTDWYRELTNEFYTHLK